MMSEGQYVIPRPCWAISPYSARPLAAVAAAEESHSTGAVDWESRIC